MNPPRECLQCGSEIIELELWDREDDIWRVKCKCGCVQLVSVEENQERIEMNPYRVILPCPKRCGRALEILNDYKGTFTAVCSTCKATFTVLGGRAYGPSILYDVQEQGSERVWEIGTEYVREVKA